MTTSANGRAERKSLAGQLDRLDGILDGLADGLNEAVAAAVKQAVVLAVEAAVRELLASAELHRHLHPEPANKPGLVRRAATALCRGLRSVAKGCWPGAAVLVGRCRARSAEAVLRVQGRRAVVMDQVRRGLSAFARRVWLGWFIVAGVARRWRKPLLVATAVGTALAVACYLGGRPSGPWPTASPASSARCRSGCSPDCGKPPKGGPTPRTILIEGFRAIRWRQGNSDHDRGVPPERQDASEMSVPRYRAASTGP